jgi:hypothetical protein
MAGAADGSDLGTLAVIGEVVGGGLNKGAKRNGGWWVRVQLVWVVAPVVAREGDGVDVGS